jgi:hypothetical protein
MAPKLWPISCATTCHSVRPLVLTAVPLTTLGALPEDFWLHTVPNHATPTSVPDGQPDMRCHRPLGSVAPLKFSNFCPRQAEKSERRSLSVAEPQATFHGLLASVEEGQLRVSSVKSEVVLFVLVCIGRDVPSLLDLHLDNTQADVERRLVQQTDGVVFCKKLLRRIRRSPYYFVYSQSAPTPIYTYKTDESISISSKGAVTHDLLSYGTPSGGTSADKVGGHTVPRIVDIALPG